MEITKVYLKWLAGNPAHWSSVKNEVPSKCELEKPRKVFKNRRNASWDSEDDLWNTIRETRIPPEKGDKPDPEMGRNLANVS